ncbi:histidine phosphatase family protein [Sorangium sp. So ce321]|uniref:histidine phosphatase family protein n=1 Tax=Sorangium sp. So ce321 TaxID=3133300 RepID=UPI003F5D5F9F
MNALDAAVPARHWRLAPEGEAQSRRLARKLLDFQPFRLVCSREPKALRTAEIVAEELSLPVARQAGLEEFDRPALPLLSAAEHALLNAPIFADPARRVLGEECGAGALERFRAALAAALADTPEDHHLVAVTHGTVIALMVAAHNRVDGFKLWRRLACPSLVVLGLPELELLEVLDQVT